MSDSPVPLPGEQRPMVWMYMPPDGDPMPCLADKVGYARGLGYVPCDAPGSVPKQPVNVVGPEETDADREERQARELEEKQMVVAEQLATIGVSRPPVFGCPDCGGSGLCPKGDIAPCWTCYPEARAAADAAVEGPALEDDSPTLGGGDNGDVIDGMPVDVAPPAPTADPAVLVTRTRCDAAYTKEGCAGLCGICPPPKKVTVRAGRELNKNRRALGLDPLKIVNGVVKGGA